MERPTSVLGLTRLALQTRWNAMSSRTRTFLAIGAVAGALLGAAGVHAAAGGACCASECPMQAAAHSGCPHHAP